MGAAATCCACAAFFCARAMSTARAALSSSTVVSAPELASWVARARSPSALARLLSA